MIVFLILLLALTLVSWAGLYKLFEKAGRPGWQAFVPVYNCYVMTQIIGKPAYWVLLLFVPIVNVFIYAYMHIDLSRSFGKKSLLENTLAVIAPFYLFPKIGFNPEEKYLGPASELPKEEKTKYMQYEQEKTSKASLEKK